MARPTLSLILVAAATTACFGDRRFQAPLREQRLASGKVVKLVSCQLAWGVEHDERFPDRDSFAIEYLAQAPRVPADGLEREVLEVFELIRPITEQWGLSEATVTALRTADRRGTYDVFGFQRSAAGTWSHKVLTISRNKD